jgi:secretory phospholipase A2
MMLILAAVAVAMCSACDQPRCSTGTYGALSGYTASTNGCGSYGVSADAPFGATPCCNQHDLCYQSCNTTKSKCDDAFDQCMKTACDDDNDLEKVACRVQAEAFFNAVMDVGCKAYKKNQGEACGCSDGSVVITDSSSASETRSALCTIASALANLIINM